MEGRSKTIRISSEDKTSTSPSNSVFTVNLPSNGGVIDSIKGVFLSSAEVPNVFPNIPEYAQILSIVKTTGSVGFDIKIPSGYYTISSLVTQLGTSINAAIGPDSVVVSLIGNAPEQKLRFTYTGDTYQMLSSGTISPRIGLLTDIGPAAVVDMDGYPNLIGETAIYIHSRTISPNRLVESDGSFSVLGKIPLGTTAFGSMAYFESADPISPYLPYVPYETPVTLRTVQIVLRNRTGQILTLPSNFSFSMMLTVFY